MRLRQLLAYLASLSLLFIVSAVLLLNAHDSDFTSPLISHVTMGRMERRAGDRTLEQAPHSSQLPTQAVEQKIVAGAASSDVPSSDVTTSAVSSNMAAASAKLDVKGRHANHAKGRHANHERHVKGRHEVSKLVGAPDVSPSTEIECKDMEQACEEWATGGECTANPNFMRLSCPKSCGTCDMIRRKAELCHRTISASPALRVGGVEATFQRLLAITQPTHKVRILSQPPLGPWVVVIDDFLNSTEIEAMRTKGGHHFERSLAGDHVSKVRTSSTSWCNVPSCESDAMVQSVKGRVANVTGIPQVNSEHVQVLQYNVGEFYREHHDQNARPQSPWGPRLFTFFLYLSDVEEGGGTRFTRLNITVQPKRGRALFWPSVLDEDPSAIKMHSDARTMHESMPVVKGRKYAANMWLHQYDFQTPLSVGCKNEDDAACGDCNGA